MIIGDNNSGLHSGNSKIGGGADVEIDVEQEKIHRLETLK